MRNAVEFLDLSCAETKESGEEEVSLGFGGVTLWSGRIGSGMTREIGTIKVMPEATGIVKFWHVDSPGRTVTTLGRHTVRQLDAEPGTMSVRFANDGADYNLSYRVLQIPE
ncbi:hypothetical protein [Streptomyces avermitilis]|uniref:hypothetical protein n=1 Tax=Streptomyces avermitilis TaxID=33903 RepID=UPI0033A6CA46